MICGDFEDPKSISFTTFGCFILFISFVCCDHEKSPSFQIDMFDHFMFCAIRVISTLI